MLLDPTDDISPSVQDMACCLMAWRHYLSRYWPSSMSHHGCQLMESLGNNELKSYNKSLTEKAMLCFICIPKMVLTLWVLDLQCYRSLRHYHASQYHHYLQHQALINNHDIVSSHKSHNASEEYPIMHHFVTEICTHVHISVTKWGTVGCGTGALWNLCNRSID